MKYLIVSDIHGSLPALEQVLAFYREQQCGMLCILGDILNYGPRNGIPPAPQIILIIRCLCCLHPKMHPEIKMIV